MAKLKAYVPKVKTFEWEGQVYGLREPRVTEAVEISAARSAYGVTLRENREEFLARPDLTASEKEQMFPYITGNLILATALGIIIAQRLVCDPEDPRAFFFSQSDGDLIEKDRDGEPKPIASEMPEGFIAAASALFNGAEIQVDKAEDAETAPLQSETPSIPESTTSESTAVSVDPPSKSLDG